MECKIVIVAGVGVMLDKNCSKWCDRILEIVIKYYENLISKINCCESKIIN